MRNLKFLFFTLLISFFCINVANAVKRLECEYYLGHNTYKVIYSLNGDNSIINNIYKSNDAVSNADVTDTYYSSFDVGLTETDSCPNQIKLSDTEILKLDDSDSNIITNLGASSCNNYKSPETCRDSGSTGNVACIWNETEYEDFCNTDKLLYVSCGDTFDIPYEAPKLISFLVNLLKIAVPVILVFVGLITMFKAVVASKEDEIKKAQSSLVKKIIAAVTSFFIISIVQFVIMKVADTTETENISKCLTCFLNNDCEDSVYYKTSVGGTFICSYLSGSNKGKTFTCKDNE